ncbi:MAG TPA: alkaline phosphatase family protein [Candidatus Acidoferrales bacterium]|nr:alkaline phosphatase family protein [Candidatus Acidoferrales bacterium]
MKRAVHLLLLLCFVGVAAQAEPATRYLVICMDGVGYDLAAEMHRKGELKNFLAPAPLIVAFPSDTNPALVEILAPLGAPPARGYEDYYFDPAANQMRGGVFHRFTHKDFVARTYRDLFDYHPHPVRMTLEYAAPVVGPWLNGAVNLERMKAEFRKSTEPVFLAYFDASDTATHLNGRWLVRQQLRELDRWVGALRADKNHPVEVIVFSDHGNDLRRLRRVNLEPALERAGFRVEGKIRDARSVAVPQFGLISNAALYTAPGRESAAAEAVRRTRGVDLAVYREGDSVVVVSRKGRARIERREDAEGVRFRYWRHLGDPLQLEGILAELEARGRIDFDGFVAEDDWLRATAEHVYPDPLRRLWNSFHGVVEQPASVLVSLDDGYYTGSIWLNMFAWMQATHGSLRRGQSLGVVLATTPALFEPDAGPFTGENLFRRILKLRDSQRAGAEAAEDVAAVAGVEVAPGVPNQP